MLKVRSYRDTRTMDIKNLNIVKLRYYASLVKKADAGPTCDGINNPKN